MMHIHTPQQQGATSREKPTNPADIPQQQQKAVNAAAKARHNLNQTMKAALALDTAEEVTFQAKHTKGACVLSRRFNFNDLQGETIPKFERSPCSVAVLADLTEEEVGTTDQSERIKLLEQLGLIDGGGTMTIAGPKPSAANNPLPLRLPLKGYYDKSQCVHARFSIERRTESKISSTTTGVEAYTLVRGEDPKNHAYFFRLIPNNKAVQMVRESVVVFNRDHRIEMSMVMPPGQKSRDSAAGVGSEWDKKLLDLLKSMLPESRYVASTGPDNGFPNERDVVLNTSHMRASTRVMARLLWAHEGLCSVVASMSKGVVPAGGAGPETAATAAMAKWASTDAFVEWLCNSDRKPAISWTTCINYIQNFAIGLKSGKKPDAKFVSTSHTAMLEQIVKMANLATAVFAHRMQGTEYEKSKLPSFGYTMTQWLLNSVAQCTLVTTEKNQNARQKPYLRARLGHVDCLFSTSGLKSTYTTDVLLHVSRKAYISPWQDVFEANAWPEWLNQYSLSAHFSNIPWAVENTISDKQVSVVLDTKYKIRFVCENFRRRFEGADPVVTGVARQNAEWARIRQSTPERAAYGIRRTGGMIGKQKGGGFKRPGTAGPRKVVRHA